MELRRVWFDARVIKWRRTQIGLQRFNVIAELRLALSRSLGVPPALCGRRHRRSQVSPQPLKLRVRARQRLHVQRLRE